MCAERDRRDVNPKLMFIMKVHNLTMVCLAGNPLRLPRRNSPLPSWIS